MVCVTKSATLPQEPNDLCNNSHTSHTDGALALCNDAKRKLGVRSEMKERHCQMVPVCAPWALFLWQCLGLWALILCTCNLRNL